MKVEAAIVPCKAAIIDHSAGLTFEVIHHVFVCNIEHGAGRKNGSPVRHQFSIAAVITPQLREVVAEMKTAGEEFGITGHAGIHGVAHGMDNSGVWQNQAYQADIEEVRGQLVDNPHLAFCKHRETRQVILPNAPESRAVKIRDTVRI